MLVTDGERVRMPLKAPLEAWRTDGRLYLWDPTHELHADITGASPAQRKAALHNLKCAARVAEGLPPYQTEDRMLALASPKLFEDVNRPLTKAERGQRRRYYWAARPAN